MGELRGGFKEFKDRVLNEFGDVRRDINDLRKDIKTLESRLRGFLTAVLIAVVVSMTLGLIR